MILGSKINFYLKVDCVIVKVVYIQVYKIGTYRRWKIFKFVL